MDETSSTDTRDDTLNILVASDIHLGYMENDPIRGNESFITFEEVLQHALVNDVDAILFGGNLFDSAKPTTNTLDRCFRLLKKYTLGDKPIKLEVLIAQNEDLVDSSTHTVNYENPNINIGLPVFSIHGDLDESIGVSRINPMDLLNTVGYVNYFAKWTDSNNIQIRPIMLRKGETKLALYGLSYMNDARLCRLLENAQVYIEKPEDPEFFNLMVLHQNRGKRGRKNCLPECSLPQFLDLVIWGHEHGCRIEPEENTKKKVYISQPGSTVATTMSEDDAKPKCCGILSIHRRIFRMDPIRLQSVRPFVFESVDLDTVHKELGLDEGDVKQKVQDFAAERIEAMIAQASTQLTRDPRQPKLPLIRLQLGSVEVEQQFNAIRFGNRYHGRVANPLNMVIFKKKPKARVRDTIDEAAMEAALNLPDQLQSPIGIVESYFLKAGAPNRMEVLHPLSMTEMCRIASYDENDIMNKVYCFYKDKAKAFLFSHGGSTEESMQEALAGFNTAEPDLHDAFLSMLSVQPKRDDATGGGRGSQGSAGSKAASTVTTWSKSQTSMEKHDTNSQPSGSNSSKASVSTRATSRQAVTRKTRRMVFDSDDE